MKIEIEIPMDEEMVMIFSFTEKTEKGVFAKYCLKLPCDCDSGPSHIYPVLESRHLRRNAGEVFSFLLNSPEKEIVNEFLKMRIWGEDYEGPLNTKGERTESYHRPILPEDGDNDFPSVGLLSSGLR